MPNAATIHHLRALSQNMGEAASRFMDQLASRLVNDEPADGFSFARSSAYTTTATAIKASAGRLYGAVVEPSSTGTSGTGGTGYVQFYNAATIANLVPGGGTATTLAMDIIKFVTGMIRCVSFDPASVDSTSLYSSGISLVVATTQTGSTAVASLPTVTVMYA